MKEYPEAATMIQPINDKNPLGAEYGVELVGKYLT